MLMYLETLLGMNLGEKVSKILSILTLHINMLLFSVNDILDFKLIEENKIVLKTHVFQLRNALKFIIDIIFETSFSGIQNIIEYQIVTLKSLESHLELH